MFADQFPSDLETAAVVALLRRGDRHWHHYAAAIESADSALAVLRGEYDDEAGTHALQLFPKAEPIDVELEPIVNEIDSWRREEIDVITILDPRYPMNLRTIHNRPPLLFVRGELTPEDEISIAIVGTRKPSRTALDLTRATAARIADAGYTVVSGLAAGIDTAAHQAALERGRRTVAVIGTGIRRTYPAANAALQHQLGEESAVVSQFWPDAPPTRQTFPMRNIVMSGLALATLVIEASNVSGARMQARFALEHGRPVFLMESLLEHEWAQEYAERPGTYVVRSADEVLARVDRLRSIEALSV